MTDLICLPHPLCSKRRLHKRKKLKVKLSDFFGPLTGLSDHKERRRPITSRFSRIISGGQADAAPRHIAIYAHYNPHARISEMVLKQLESIRESGFEIMLVSMSQIESEEDLAILRPLVRSIVIRKSFGRDFGAWHDVIQSNQNLMRGAEELLLVNDSLLGPFAPIIILFESMRQCGDGVFGLTDSPDQEPHLQSYFLLFRGADRHQYAAGFHEHASVVV